jgi:hypothetical protein
VIALAWLFAYRSLGYGASGSGLYVDPGREPLRFLLTAAEQGPVLLLGQLGVADPLPYYLISLSGQHLTWIGAFLFLLFVGSVFLPLAKGSRTVGFWTTGMLLSLVLVSGVQVTTGRPLLFVGIGAMGLVAHLIGIVCEKVSPLLNRPYWRLSAFTLTFLFILVHMILSPLNFAARTALPLPSLLRLEETLNLTTPPGVERQHLVVVNAPNTFSFLYFPSLWTINNRPVPARTRILAPGSTSVEIARIDSATILVRPKGGFLVPPGSTIGSEGDEPPLLHPAYYFQHYDKTFRSDADPMNLGERIELSGMTVEVSGLTADGRPLEALVHFSAPLEASRYRWLQWDWSQGAYRDFTPPDIGDSIWVPGPPTEMPTGLELRR